MRAVTRAPTLEHQVVELVTGDGERVVRTSARGSVPPMRLRPPCADRTRTPAGPQGDAATSANTVPKLELSVR
jgi:hypothetical protein